MLRHLSAGYDIVHFRIAQEKNLKLHVAAIQVFNYTATWFYYKVKVQSIIMLFSLCYI